VSRSRIRDLTPQDLAVMGSSDVIAEGSYPAPRQWLDVPATKDYSLVFPIDRSKHKVSFHSELSLHLLSG
jgi:hypothetical protein